MMKENCFDEATIQAFLDGELPSDRLESVARHVAVCDLCAVLLEQSEEESAFAFAALDSEFNALVPTERIRTNLYQAISELERPRISLWQKLLSFGSVFSSPSVAAFASLLMIAGLGFMVWDFANNNTTTTNDISANKVTDRNTAATETLTPMPPPAPTINDGSAAGSEVFRPQVKAISASYRTPVTRQPVRSYENNAPAEAISGEATYIKTIATLTTTVNDQKDTALNPTARVAFEKDLAMANDTITRMKREVGKNPKNEAAKQVLKNSYQNKIDLLNSVTERSELMALR